MSLNARDDLHLPDDVLKKAQFGRSDAESHCIPLFEDRLPQPWTRSKWSPSQDAEISISRQIHFWSSLVWSPSYNYLGPGSNFKPTVIMNSSLLFFPFSRRLMKGKQVFHLQVIEDFCLCPFFLPMISIFGYCISGSTENSQYFWVFGSENYYDLKEKHPIHLRNTCSDSLIARELETFLHHLNARSWPLRKMGPYSKATVGHYEVKRRQAEQLHRKGSGERGRWGRGEKY